jgi:multicomponent Na+:H+ antiporter subunit E
MIWFLPTANLSVTNTIIGISVALLLPKRIKSLGALKDWLLAQIVTMRQVYFEAFEFLVCPHNIENFNMLWTYHE